MVLYKFRIIITISSINTGSMGVIFAGESHIARELLGNFTVCGE